MCAMKLLVSRLESAKLWSIVVAALSIVNASCGRAHDEPQSYPFEAAKVLISEARESMDSPAHESTCKLLDESRATHANEWLNEVIQAGRLADATIEKSDKWGFDDVVTVTFVRLPQRDSVIVMSFYLINGKCHAFALLEMIE